MSDEAPSPASSAPPRRLSLLQIGLLAALFVGLVAPLAVSSWYSFRLQRDTLSASFQFEMDQMANTLANGLSGPVWNLIPASGQPLVAAAMRDPRIRAIRVYSGTQSEFLAAGDFFADDPGVMPVQRDIQYGSQVIGSLIIYVDTSANFQVLDEQWRRIGVAAAVELVAVLVVVALVGWLYSRHQRTALLRDTLDRLEREVEERRRTEAALRESEERFRGVIDNSPSAIFLKDIDGKFRFVNTRFSQWYGWEPDKVFGKTSHDIYPKPYADFFTAQDRAVLESGKAVEVEHDIPFADGSIHLIIVNKFPVFGSDGTVIGIGTISSDVTDQRHAEEGLRRAHRLEAIGQLTGGLAHDFNNLLAIVRGNAELLQDEVGDNPLLNTINRATVRGAEVTQRLLAFARQQPLHPKRIDLGEQLSGLDALFQSTLGEAIKIVTEVPADTWPVVADPGQLENALLNLAINARDAMPTGGTLTIRCTNISLAEGVVAADAELAPGEYVCISVCDTGAGMPDNVRERAFEPFFTTKDVGHGSGLGLSMVYGFARQSQGDVEIESNLGSGTEIRLYLPRSRAADTPALPLAGAHTLPRGNGEVVLVLEDEPDVRSFAVTCLSGLGYRVREAEDGMAAQEILAEGERIDVLLSDVVLPGGVSGPMLAKLAKVMNPDLKIVFMTGHAPDAETYSLIRETGNSLLHKPFGRHDLAGTVHAALQGQFIATAKTAPA